MEYIVANHKFVINGVTPDLLWQYEPFRVENRQEKPLFVVDYSYVDSVEKSQGLLIGDFKDDEFVVKVYSLQDAIELYLYNINSSKPYMVIESSGDFSQNSVYIIGDTDPVYAINNSIMMLYAFASATYNTMLFHSSVTVYKNKAYMFLGKSGTGKSTHSSMWLKSIEGTHLLNDDNPVVRIYSDGSVVVYGSPWSGKTPCYRNEAYSLGAIVRIWQKPENKIEHLKGVKALAMVLPTVSSLPSCKGVQDSIQKSIIKLVENSSIYSLGCLPNVEAAQLCNSTVAQ